MLQSAVRASIHPALGHPVGRNSSLMDHHRLYLIPETSVSAYDDSGFMARAAKLLFEITLQFFYACAPMAGLLISVANLLRFRITCPLYYYISRCKCKLVTITNFPGRFSGSTGNSRLSHTSSINFSHFPRDSVAPPHAMIQTMTEYQRCRGSPRQAPDGNLFS